MIKDLIWELMQEIDKEDKEMIKEFNFPYLSLRDNHKESATIKKYITDFIVQEIHKDLGIAPLSIESAKNMQRKEEKKGKHLYCILIKHGMETFSLIKRISTLLNLSPSRICVGGIKDKRAYTSQYISFYNLPKHKITYLNLFLSSSYIIPLFYEKNKIHNSMHEKNKFIITLRDIQRIDDDIIKEIKGNGDFESFFPNYYGIQRFGENISSAFLGYLLLKREWEKFVKYFLYETMQRMQKGSDVKEDEGKNKINPIEKRILTYLEKHELKDLKGALSIFPYSLLRLCISAYQSWIFNLVLKEIVKEVKEKWKDMEKDEWKKKKIVLPGYNTEHFVLSNKEHEKIKEILEKHGISNEMFYIKELKIRVDGYERMCFSHAENIRIIQKNEKKGILKISFVLPRGSYATIFLNEFFYLF